MTLGSVAIIGGGLAGLTCAQTLATLPGERSADSIVVYDKARGPGGRMSTRRTRLDRETGDLEVAFDHGAQYFTARSAAFRRVVEEWQGQGTVEPWRAELVDLSFEGALREVRPSAKIEGETAWVGTPRMSTVLRTLVRALEEDGFARVRYSSRVEALEARSSGWQLRLEDGETVRHDTLVVAAPAPQAAELLTDAHRWSEDLTEIDLDPCHALLVAFENPLASGFDAAFVSGHPVVAWVARDASKPRRSRDGVDTWVLHTTPGWSRNVLEIPPGDLEETLVEALQSVLATDRAPELRQVHRWRYARASRPLGEPSRWDPEARLGLCGDWCLAGRVEAAFESGLSLGRRMAEGSTPRSRG